MIKAISGPKQLAAFSLIVAAILFSNSVSSQTAPTRAGLNTVNTLGNNNLNGAYRRVLYIPQDTATTADSGAVAFLNGSFYLKDKTNWFPHGKARTLNDSSFIVGKDTIVIRGTGGGGGSGTVTQVNTSYGLTGGPVTTTGTIKVDTSGANGITTRSELKDTILSLRAKISDTLIYALQSILIPSRLEFIATSDTATYQDDDLIGAQIMIFSIESYQVGFTSRATSVYASFDTSTGTITLTNGLFAVDDQVIIIYRTPPVFLLDSNGNPVRDINGNFIILN